MAVTIEQIKASAIERKLKPIADELGIEKFKVKYNISNDRVTLRTKVCKNQSKSTVRDFVDKAGDFILSNEYAREVRFTYPTRL
ncbi:hypothetical protein [Peribacillus asahii]|uniref:hypothetical protein n=1 Tax=Peribacillus asahii TaxID=228899 RepID=UPI0037FA3B05